MEHFAETIHGRKDGHGIKVYDCFMFNGEWDVLELRLNTHCSAVDYFVIVESNSTHTGQSKKLQFDISDPRIKDFASKIRYVLVSDMPNNGDPWKNDSHQRDAIIRGLWDSTPSDLIIISDCDEIVKPEYIKQAAEQIDFDIFGFQQPMYYCYMNNRMTGHWADRIWSVAVRAHKLKQQTATWYRGNLGAEPYFWYANAGWHYSYMMDLNQIKNKIANSTHQEFNTPDLLNELDPASAARRGKDLLGRDYITWVLEDLSQVDFPDYVKINWDKYKKYIIR